MKATSFVVSVFCTLLPSTSAFTHSNNCPKQISSSRQTKSLVELNLFQSAQEAIVDATRICAQEGAGSDSCKVAWGIVEEFKAADSDDRREPFVAHPLSYSPMVQGLDILSSKLDRKLDELRNLSEQLASEGAGPEVERLVYASDEMKQVLAEARVALINLGYLDA